MDNSLSLGEKIEMLIELNRSVNGVGDFISKELGRINKTIICRFVVCVDNTKYSVTRNVDADSPFWTIRNLKDCKTTKLNGEWDLPYFNV